MFGLRSGPAEKSFAKRAASLVVGDTAAQDREEKGSPFVDWPVAVLAGQGEHGVLHDIERIIIIPHCVAGHVPGPLFHSGQEDVQFCCLAHLLFLTNPGTGCARAVSWLTVPASVACTRPCTLEDKACSIRGQFCVIGSITT